MDKPKLRQASKQGASMSVNLSKETLKRLTWLAANYYVVKGERPMALKTVVARMVDDVWDEANPPKYMSPIGRGD